MSKQTTIQTILSSQVVAIVRLKKSELVLDLISALCDAGVDAVEVTSNTPDYLNLIKNAQLKFPELCIGAGTITNKTEAIAAINAGAKYLVTPNTNIETLEVGIKNEIPVLMGAFSPSEMHLACQEGASMLKLFPANYLGMDYMKAVKATLPSIPIVPTGGISLSNGKEWLNQGAAALGVGSAIINSQALINKDFDKVAKHALKFLNSLKEN